MFKRTVLTVLAGTGVVLWLASVPYAEEDQPAAPGATTANVTRVGTFCTSDLVVAYYRSEAFDKRLQTLSAERDKAQAAGDEKKVAELESQGAAMQERAHKQLVGEAPITDILQHLAPSVPEVAKEAGVPVIAGQVIYRDPSVRPVDVTELLVKKLKPARAK